jgi:hypothetical protein
MSFSLPWGEIRSGIRRRRMFGRGVLEGSVKRAALTFAFVGAVTFTSSLGRAFASPEGHCRIVLGRLLDEHLEGPVAVAKMTGVIKGKYTYTLKEQFPADAVFSNLIYITGTSVVKTKDGTLSFFETSTQDTDEPGNLNGTVLMTIIDGTGKWTGATGHIVLIGAFHQDTLTGDWLYQGKVCLP